MPTWVPYLEGAHQWLNPGDNAWQMTAATFVGLMSLPGLAVLYGGVMQKRWSVNSMMLTFVAFSLVLVAWVLWAFKMGFGSPIGGGTGFFDTFWGKSGTVLGAGELQKQAVIPSISTGPPFHFPQASLIYFQFVFAAITPILIGSAARAGPGSARPAARSAGSVRRLIRIMAFPHPRGSGIFYSAARGQLTRARAGHKGGPAPAG